MNDQEKRIRLAYAGKRLSLKDKVFHSYYNIETGLMINFTKPIIQACIGSIIEATEVEDGVKSPYNFAGKYKDEIKVGEWVGNSESVTLKVNANKNMKALTDNSYYTSIERLRMIYYGMSPSMRTAFLFRLNQDIQNK